MSRQGLAELGEMLHTFDDVMNRVPEARAQALEAAADAVKKEVDRQIIAQLPNHDKHGTVRRWQEVAMGSRGGYAKVAPIPKSRAEKTEDGYYSSQITFWLEHGHKMVPPTRNRYGRVKQYLADEDKTPYNWSGGFHVVTGKLFYSWAKMTAVKEAENAATLVLDEIEYALDNM